MSQSRKCLYTFCNSVMLLSARVIGAAVRMNCELKKINNKIKELGYLSIVHF